MAISSIDEVAIFVDSASQAQKGRGGFMDAGATPNTLGFTPRVLHSPCTAPAAVNGGGNPILREQPTRNLSVRLYSGIAAEAIRTGRLKQYAAWHTLPAIADRKHPFLRGLMRREVRRGIPFWRLGRNGKIVRRSPHNVARMLGVRPGSRHRRIPSAWLTDPHVKELISMSCWSDNESPVHAGSNLSVRAMARRLGVSERTLQRYRKWCEESGHFIAEPQFQVLPDQAILPVMRALKQYGVLFPDSEGRLQRQVPSRVTRVASATPRHADQLPERPGTKAERRHPTAKQIDVWRDATLQRRQQRDEFAAWLRKDQRPLPSMWVQWLRRYDAGIRRRGNKASKIAEPDFLDEIIKASPRAEEARLETPVAAAKEASAIGVLY